jgi:two-component SAPR family response regulator
MPEINGYQLVEQVKKIKPDIKVLIISAFEFDLNLPDNFSRSDVDEFVEKPITIAKLNKLVLAQIHSNSGHKADKSKEIFSGLFGLILLILYCNLNLK